MAILHNSNYQHQPSLMESIGSKVKTGMQIAGTVKSIWDVGRSLYHGAQALAPVAGAVARMLL